MKAKEKNKKGISLIVLVITIVVMVIIAAAVIITLNNNNPINEANESAFKSNIRQMYEELNIYIADMNSQSFGEFDAKKFSANLSSVTYTGRGVEIKEKNIKEIIISLNQLPKYETAVSIVNGKLTLDASIFSDKQLAWADEVLGEAKDVAYVKDGLLAHFDGTNNTGDGHSTNTTKWADLSGNGNDATLTGFSYTATSGWADNALCFDGNDDVVDLNTNFKAIYSGNNTVEMAVYFNEENTRDVLFSNFNGAGYAIERAANNNSRFYWNSNPDVYGTNQKMKSGEIIYFSCVFNKDTKTVTMYKNGDEIILNTTNNGLASLAGAGGNYKIGKDTRNGATALNGKIYSVRIYNKVLSKEEIMKNYNIDKSKFE